MITKVVRGWRAGGLIAYLLGPGRSEEHRRPRVIASWDGLDAGWQPARTGPGEWDLDLGPLIARRRWQPACRSGPTSSAGRGTSGIAQRGSRLPIGCSAMRSGRRWRANCWTVWGSRRWRIRVGRAGSRCGMRTITFTSRWCWGGRARAGGSGRTWSTRGCGRRRVESSGGWG